MNNNEVPENSEEITLRDDFSEIVEISNGTFPLTLNSSRWISCYTATCIEMRLNRRDRHGKIVNYIYTTIALDYAHA
jgi:hypothetical protein